MLFFSIVGCEADGHVLRLGFAFFFQLGRRIYNVIDGKRMCVTEHSTKNEQQRILQAGGTVVDGRVLGVLMPSRAIGDSDVKKACPGVCARTRACVVTCIYCYLLLFLFFICACVYAW